MLPQTPLLFMGQEWAASSPFRFFTDHDSELGSLVTEGRRREFRHFKAFADPALREAIPDPQTVATFEASKLDWSERAREPHGSVLRLYSSLLALRRFEPALRSNTRGASQAVAVGEATIVLLRGCADDERLAVVVRLEAGGTVDLAGLPAMTLPDERAWRLVLTTEDPPFAHDAAPPRIDWSPVAPMVEFLRPGAVILRAEPRREKPP
jgi:maltooligosyltrehalose trehalohydrolase